MSNGNGWAMKIISGLVGVAILTSLAVAGNDRTQDKAIETVEERIKMHAEELRLQRDARIRAEGQFKSIDESLARITEAVEVIAEKVE